MRQPGTLDAVRDLYPLLVPDEAELDADDRQDVYDVLFAVVDLALLLDSMTGEFSAANEEDVEYARLTIEASFQSFLDVRQIGASMAGVGHLSPLRWRGDLSVSRVRDELGEGVRRLRDPSASIPERWLTLLAMAKVSLVFVAMTY